MPKILATVKLRGSLELTGFVYCYLTLLHFFKLALGLKICYIVKYV